jgi:hypothetical protein
MISLPDILLPKIKHFGLSIERLSLHAVEVDQRGVPTKATEIQIPQDTFIQGTLAKPDVFAQAVKSLVVSGRFSTPYVAVTFPEVFAYTRGYTIPLIPIDEIQEAISWHAKDLFPFPQEDIYFDWKILEKREHEYQTTVVATQKNVLDPLVGALVSIGLKPLRFEPDASALTRLLLLKSPMHAILIEVNKLGAYITLVEGEKALFTTVIPYTSEDTPTSYLANIDQTLVEIATFYRNKGVLGEGSTEVIITGSMASDEWVKHLKELLRYPVGILRTQMQDAAYNKAYVAAIQKIAPPSDPQSINLLPFSTQTFYDAQRTDQFYRTLLARLCVFAGILCFISSGSHISISLERQRLDTNVKALQKLNQSQSGGMRDILLLNSQAKNVMNLIPLRHTPEEKIEALNKLLTDTITITQWEYDDSKLQFTLTGNAKTRDDLLAFKQSLDQSKDFAKVTLPLVSLETSVQTPFIITFLVKD